MYFVCTYSCNFTVHNGNEDVSPVSPVSQVTLNKVPKPPYFYTLNIGKVTMSTERVALRDFNTCSAFTHHALQSYTDGILRSTRLFLTTYQNFGDDQTKDWCKKNKIC